jgi:hypothetical protein
MAKKHKTRKGKGFLDGYQLQDTYLQQPDRALGQPGLIVGTAAEGMPVLVKVWPRRANAKDEDLQEIWHHELRQLHRLAGYPGSHEVIAHLLRAGMDEKGFYLILDLGQKSVLRTITDRGNPSHWLNQPRFDANRLLIWQNLKRLSAAIEILHSQGLLHRKLDASSVLTAGRKEADFQLTGFEWAVRLTSAIQTLAKPSARNGDDSENYSFKHDWLLFALLAADLLGVSRNRLLDLRVAPFEVADHLVVDEIRLLREIADSELAERGGVAIISRIDEVVRLLSAKVAGLETKFHLVMRLGSGTPLSTAIRQASQEEIEADDNQGQLEFVQADLAEAQLLMLVKARLSGEEPRLVLRGHHLLYALRQYRYPRPHAVPSWEFAFCEIIEARSPAPVNLINSIPLDPTSLDVMSVSAGNERFPLLGGKRRSWEELRDNLTTEEKVQSREERVHRALTLTQFLDALFAAADVFPVEIIEGDDDNSSEDGSSMLRVRPRPDADREALSTALNLKPVARRFEAALLGDNVQDEGWILTDSKTLGERKLHDTEWHFQEPMDIPGEPQCFAFTGPSFVPSITEAYLVPAGSVGRDVQLKRRLKALGALKNHIELLKMLSDPRHQIFDSFDKFSVDDALKTLDIPKQEALRELTATIPLYLVQGPPGVGKTRLVRDLVRRRFGDEPTTRLLLTAQSNSAVDHLMDELDESLRSDIGQQRPLVVRSRARESSESGPFEIGQQSREIIRNLLQSTLVENATAVLKERARELSASLEKSSSHDSSTTHSAYTVRAFEGLIVRAANIVFATTNSGELERLIDERAQFDWTIVEEAAKATGGEIVSPLMLSHRRLLIGDHKQLPAFGLKEMRTLLEVPESVKNVLTVGEEFIGRSLRDSTTEEILDDVDEDSGDLPALCSEAIRVLTLFESIIEPELRRQAASRPGRPIAKKLTVQHRMHPSIANLISKSFYGGDLDTAETRKNFFSENTPPFISTDTKRIPEQPIIFIDIPYVQREMGAVEGDQLPRWHNDREVRAVIEVLAAHRAASSGKPPSLAVLSPYLQQVRRLNDEIDREWNGRLQHLSEFSRAAPAAQGISATVDSFQGNEADLVIVSLVRNNHHSNVRNALGFLTDFRRMNVLLSRARWRLVLVGSKEFLNTIIKSAKGTDQEDEIAFLELFLRAFSDEEKAQMATTISEATLRGLAS